MFSSSKFIFNIYALTWEEIERFCGKCASYREKEFCPTCGEINQTRYVARGYCGYARVGAQCGKIFSEGLEKENFFKLTL